jgi:hypothetical protein
MPGDIKDTYIHGYRVYYYEDAAAGVEHLKFDLDRSEARVFFDQARLKGSCPFEDDEERNFTLTYQAGKYYLDRR